MLAILEGIQQAEAELQAAALGPKPPPPQPWGMDGADQNPALFKLGQAGTGAALPLRGLPCRLSDQQAGASPQLVALWSDSSC